MIPKFGTDTTILYILLSGLKSVSSVLISTKSNDVNVMHNVVYVVRRTGQPFVRYLLRNEYNKSAHLMKIHTWLIKS